MANNMYDHIPQEMFTFVQKDAVLRDQKLETKARGFLADAMVRFKKNKSSVIAAYIIMFLLLFSWAAPIISPYDVKQADKRYVNTPPFVRQYAEKGMKFFDGGVVRDSQNDASMDYWNGIAQETGMNPVLEILSSSAARM